MPSAVVAEHEPIVERSAGEKDHKEYIEARGFHLRGAVGAAVLGTCGAAVVFSPPSILLGPIERAGLIALGWMLFAVGLGIRFWSTLYVGGRKVGGRRESILVVDGPYSVVRNPLYFGSFLVGLSAIAFLPSVTLIAALVPVVLHYSWVTIPAEERFLARLVGEATFAAYAARTPRFIPSRSCYRAGAEGAFYVKALRNEARRALRLAIVPIGLTIIAAARYEPWWPTWFRLP